MKKPRVLFNFDTSSPEAQDFLKNPNIDIDTKYLIDIGTKRSADILIEYDVIILNLKSPYNLINERWKQILDFIIKEDKVFIYILNKQAYGNGIDNMGILKEMFSLSDVKIDLVIDNLNRGSNYEITSMGRNNIIYEYLNSPEKEWEISFEIDEHMKSISSLADNIMGNSIAFIMADERIRAKNYFIPLGMKNHAQFFKVIDKILIEYNSSPYVIDEWVKQYTFPVLEETKSIINQKETKIIELQKEKELCETKQKEYERIRNVLLYCDGKELETICSEVISFLGLNIEYGKQGREDLVFSYKEEHFIIEVKGSEKSASKKNISQLRSHITVFEEEVENKAKGILLINAWRRLPLEERDTNDKPIFPNDIMTLVELSGIALMTTQQLFVAYCKKLENNFDLDVFVSVLKETSGRLPGYNNIQKYKTKTK